MRFYYREAKKLGDEAVRAAVKNGVSPYLPVLDTFEEVKHPAGEVHVGLMELAVSRIRGNKELGRNNAFANNFMPIFSEDSEFASKWTALYNSYAEEGIREAIKCYEYMNWYYVQEGNKRVSVSKFGGSEFILADVIRILPVKNDSKEVKVYYEYLDFYNATKNNYIILSEPGEYEKLASMLGQDLVNKWPEELCTDLKAAFFKFVKLYRTVLKLNDEFTASDAFLVYISIFPMKTLFEDTEEQIIKNIRLARNELQNGGSPDNIAFLNTAPEGEKSGGIIGLFTGAKNYTASAPLRVGFVYDADAEKSRWIGSHELGRFYVDKMTSDNVVTQSYTAGADENGVTEAIEKAIEDKNEIIFTVSPEMMADTLKAAVHHQTVKFLNCSIGQSHPSVRSYHGKLYEASFLMGVLAADTLLLEKHGREERRIGYIVRGETVSVADLNAFAIGVSMIDPECRIILKHLGENDSPGSAEEWQREGISMYADFEYSTEQDVTGIPGVYLLDGGKETFIGAPYFNWGKYYVQIVQSVISGAWDLNEIVKLHSAANYWFGLSTGVVDIRTPELPYQTKKMISFFKKAIIRGGLDPFSGEIRSQDEMIQEETKHKNSHISSSLENMTAGKILAMDWLNENIEGVLPPKTVLV